MTKTRSERILEALNSISNLISLSVIDESYRHHVPQGAQTHFSVTLVSSDFENTSLIQRHRVVNKLLETEFSTGMHALSIHAYTPQEWKKRQQTRRDSPPCLDGFKHNGQAKS